MNKLIFSLGIAISLLSACGTAEKKADTSASETTNTATVAAESKTQEATTTANATTGNDNPDLAYLRKLAGQYPHDAKLLESGLLKTRLEKLLGTRMAALDGGLQTAAPMH